ncbi:LysM peptidoglycan-binding domain-containing protein [Pseudomonas sp. B21-053]|uniref:LysM peptidoglycan-binding domain-containing protein n=1 Tax=Pseudomonas sp. B21-053 TaxID=2895493 RepID=UPI00222F1497|nr:LysM domain-containing protein [Pseudomonas sp. B21-053]UZE14988.1 LysM peptidoglycan-binding domain-containing protein [Pseudomonas sp. B21-053]
METINHSVVLDETLSEIAVRYNTTVAQLRQMNPFIANPDEIKPGWNLSVPKSAQTEVAAQPAAAPVEPAQPTQKTETPSTPATKPIDLGPKKRLYRNVCPQLQRSTKALFQHIWHRHLCNRRTRVLVTARAGGFLDEGGNARTRESDRTE